MRRRAIAPALLVILTLSPSSSRGQDCAVTPDPSWKGSIDYPDEPFAVDPAPNPRWVKFTILSCDPTRVYFQNSREFPLHFGFATSRLDPLRGMSREAFDEATLFLEGQKAVLGAVILPPATIRNVNDFGIQFAGRDPYPAERIVELFHRVAAAVQSQGARPYYFPSFEQQEAAEAKAAFLAERGVPLGSAGLWAEGNAIYAEGWALGTLKFVPVGEIEAAYRSGALGPDDVLLTDGVPAEVPFVQGILSLSPATPNSHVAILAANYGVPFAHLALPEDAERARELDGKRVIVSAFHDFLQSEFRLHDVESLPAATVAEILALKELPPLALTPLTRAGIYSVAVAELDPSGNGIVGARGIVGGKAAHYSLLLDALPGNARVAASFTFDLWTDFLEQRLGNGRTLRQEIDERLAEHASYPPPDVGALATALEGVRDLFEDDAETSFATPLREAVLTALQDPRYGFDPQRRIRFRSSTNFEDGEHVTGAGLFDSKSGCLLDDLDGDEVGPSHCDAAENSERGVFRALRRVFASFYYENAYLERRRWGVDESQVGMAVLVHHSFPDETELANGVATLLRNGSFYTVDMVTQTGATSVANPGDGSIPETVRLQEFRGSVDVDFVSPSNLLPLGVTVLDWKTDYEDFGALFVAVARAYEAATGKGGERYALDFEYKKIAPGDQLIVKQVRPLPQPDREPSRVPFLLDVPVPLTVFQGEQGDLFANHRLKSSWLPRTRNTWLTEESLAEGIFSHLEVEYSDGCEVFRFAGATASLPGAEQSYADGEARLRWDFDELANPRHYELSASQIPLLVSPAQSPFVTLADLRLQVRVRHEQPVLGRGGVEETELVVDEWIALAPEPAPRPGDLEQVRSFSSDGVSITTRFYWPPPPSGIVAGYTAPLVRWVETVIEGLTTEPLVLLGERSQTYRPGHHNFTEHFLFAPHEEEGISSQALAELDERGVRWIELDVDSRIENYSACDLRLACACRAPDADFRRGDTNSDGELDIGDPIANLDFQFIGQFRPPCLDACDFNDDGTVDVSDPIASLTHQFVGGPAPALPGKESCGPDPGEDELDCRAYTRCP